MTDNIRVLVAESYGSLCEQWAILLDSCDGLQVVGTADNGKKALEVCQQQRPHVVLLSVQMPVIEGFTVARIMHQQFPAVQVIMLANDERSHRSLAYENGASACLIKPVSLAKLVSVIRAVHENPAARNHGGLPGLINPRGAMC